MLRSLLAAAALACAGAAPLAAQAAHRPAAWRTVPDVAGTPDSALAFVTMPPGWHLTAEGSGGVLWDPAHAAPAGAFVLESEQFLFSLRPGTGTGLLVGGRSLGAADARWTAFVVGPDARYRVLRHEGGATRELVPWTAHAAIPPHEVGKPNVKLVLGVAGDARVVRFTVNGAAVAELPRATVAPEGTIGLRVEPGANAHVATLTLDGKNVAPAGASH
ncbi:hypothetical protein [Roseisolibacter sp. H3M3-2]|uniref:hypothetical protein n=1 Tax=Roseisolibacter sp. H3M3-2 TaxID=3031323 RepID=UPI0023DA9445|nr:hypothetical protein [Roseisolibacter sp. H3M3-2]MDF1503974.1 hypothetical protein [Roseisolibacter sp. H3M3-2]